MCDHDPNDETVLRQPAGCQKCGALPTDACAKTDGWCEDVSRRLAERNSPWIAVSNKTVTCQPAATISAEEIAEMRARCVRPDQAEIDRVAACIAAKPGNPAIFWNILSWSEQTDEAMREHAQDEGYDEVPTVYVENRQYNRDRVAAWRRLAFEAIVNSRSDMPRLLDAIEALTAHLSEAKAIIAAQAEQIDRMTDENARLTSENDDIRTMIADPQMVHLGMLRGGIAKPSLRNMLHLNGDNALRIWDEAVETRIELAGVTAERDALKAEAQELRLQCLSHEGQAHAAYEAQKKAEAEAIGLRTEMEAAYGDLANSLMTGFSHGRATAKELQERIERAKAILEVAIFGRPANWYATHRAKVEADHAAAKATADDAAFAAVVERQLSRAERADRLWNAPMRDVIVAIRPALNAGAAAKDDGIDMDLLGKLCREEPDEATKREVGAMMDKLNRTETER